MTWSGGRTRPRLPGADQIWGWAVAPIPLDAAHFRYLYTQKFLGAVLLTNSKDIVRRLEAEGWVLVSTTGSHHKFRKGDVSLIVPHPKKDLPLGTARSIARSAGWLKDPR